MPTILVVDDDPAIRDFLDLLLSDEGYNVILAHDGTDALATLAHTPVQAVLCDVMMPGLSGHEVCKAIRKEPRLHTLPVILMSALADPTMGANAGATAYLVKPFGIPVLLRLLGPLVDSVASVAS